MVPRQGFGNARMTPATIENPATSLSLAEATVRRNILSTLAGNVVFSGTQWLITVAIARLGDMAMVGQYALGLAVCTPIFAFTGLQVRAVQATDCTGEFRFEDYVTVRLAGTVCSLVAVAAVSWLMPWQRGTVLVVLAVACSRSVDSFSDVLYGLFQLRDRLDLIARAMVIRGGCGLAALALTMLVFRSAAAAVAALTAAWFLVLLIYERPIALRMAASSSAQPRLVPLALACRRLAALCLPLAFVLLLLSLSTSLPRIMLERYGGDRALGVFSAVAAMSGAIGLVYTALGQTALPRLARMFTSSPGQFRAAMGQMMLFAGLVGLTMVIGAWFWGVRLVAMVYGHQSAVTAELVTGLVAVGVIGNTSSLLGTGLTASRRFRPLLVASLMILAITAVASALLVPRWGARGAMYAGLAGVCFQTLILGYLCWQDDGRR